MGDELARFLIGSESGPRLYHEECSIRAVIGGLNHLMGSCTCCGGTEPPDPPRLGKREAAKQAVMYWRHHREKH